MGTLARFRERNARRLKKVMGVYWDIAKKEGKNNVRLPVRYRCRSPVIFEFHATDKLKLMHTPLSGCITLRTTRKRNISIPIWKTDKDMRLTQNYITEENFRDIPDIKIEEVGRLQFQGRFKAGTSEDHSHFVMDNYSKETQETWEDCHSESIPETMVTKEMPPAVQELHDQSLTQGRDVVSQADESEKQKWVAKDGTDWSGAFGQDRRTLSKVLH